VYVRFGVYTPLRHFQTLPDILRLSQWAPPESHLDIYPSNMADVKQHLKDRLKYVASFPLACEEYGIDIWRYGGDACEVSLETQWNIDPFLSSTNYKMSDEERDEFRHWVLQMIRHKEWSQLFGEDD
jgi:hypothetical protein